MTMTHRAPFPSALRRVCATIGGAAAIVGCALSLSANAAGPVTVDDAHAKFQVVTVIAKPQSSAPATITETNRSHQLAVTRATPDIRPPRTVVARP
jgi:hypothetical protein